MSNETIDVESGGFSKAEWQRQDRKRFKEANGYSRSAHYGAGGLRKAVLERDRYQCVSCGMTDAAHKAKWGRPITIDHRDKNRKHNTLENLQTLCLSCHSVKDFCVPSKVGKHKDKILFMRAAGTSCNRIAQEIGVGCKIITRWLRRWNQGSL